MMLNLAVRRKRLPDGYARVNTFIDDSCPLLWSE